MIFLFVMMRPKGLKWCTLANIYKSANIAGRCYYLRPVCCFIMFYLWNFSFFIDSVNTFDSGRRAMAQQVQYLPASPAEAWLLERRAIEEHHRWFKRAGDKGCSKLGVAEIMQEASVWHVWHFIFSDNTSKLKEGQTWWGAWCPLRRSWGQGRG